ncbi:MAG: hypothetical protein FOGNACKC_00819 [Anaerolineae bacterium]|nr:hypothetical protein [Anaerolineae bacterium]
MTDSKPVEWYVEDQVARGKWRAETIPAAVVGLPRDVTVFRARRKDHRIMHAWHGDKDTFCPPIWWDLAIGSGACGLGCRSCVGADQWIYTDLGPVRAKDLYRRRYERQWLVMGVDENYNHVFTPLIGAAETEKPSHDMVTIKLDTGHQVTVTDDHPMIVARPGRFEGWDGDFKASGIKEDDWLPIIQYAVNVRHKVVTSLDLLRFPWAQPEKIRVTDLDLAGQFGLSCAELAKQLGQTPSPNWRDYPLSNHANKGVYHLPEYIALIDQFGLIPGDSVQIHSAYGSEKYPRWMPLDRAFGFVVGHYLAEGSLDKRTVVLAVHKDEVEYCLPKWEQWSGKKVVVRSHSENGAMLLLSQTTIVALFREMLPGNAFTKQYPQMLWDAPKEFIEGVLEGAIFGDGHLDKAGSIVYATCSEGWAADMRMLMWRLGYSPVVVRNNYRGDKIAYQVRLHQQDATNFVRQVGLPWHVIDRSRRMITRRYPYALLMARTGSIWGDTGATRWKQRLEAEKIDLCEWGKKLVEGELGLSRVKKILKSSAEAEVYDFQTGTGNFVAGDGVLIHNCFLMLTHRIRRDPWRHLLYDNIDDFERDAEKWLLEPGRKPFHTLGVGIDRSDSLLYEGVTGMVRRLNLLFGDHERNPRNTKLVLLTKSKNTLYLADVPPAYRYNTVVTFSLNPEPVADMWEGKYPDGVRITPPIYERLQAARFAANIGYEIRVRLDPILTPDGWQEMYREFVADIKAMRINFRYWTLGTYREKNNQLDTWREKWGLLPMEWQPGDEELVKDGTHFHMPVERRMEIYQTVRDIIHAEFPGALVSLCKETHGVRQGVGLCNADCNCLR